VFSCGLAVWAVAAGSAAAFPGMAACRVPERWVTQGWCHLRPGIQIEDTGGIRIVLAGFSPLAPGALTGDRFRRQDDGPRAACICGRRCQRLAIKDDPVGGN
jgi:hypothetical protein